MAQRVTKNTWERGLNTDAATSKILPAFATDINNLETIGDGNFYNLTNIKGTTTVDEVSTTANTVVLGVFKNKYTISSVATECLTIFTATPSGNFVIYCYDTENVTLYTLFTEAIDDSNAYFTDDRVIDAIGYSENGVDYLYFTDNYHEPRSLRCDAPATLSAADLSLQRRGANGKVNLSDVATGGSLLSGTYQFAYRMVDPTNKRFTKWSGLTNPIHVYDDDISTTPFTTMPINAGIGLNTTYKIVIDVVPSSEETTDFTHFQVAVVENVYPLGAESIIDAQNTTFVASLLPIELNSALTSYNYKSNTKVNTIPIEELVVDLAAIRQVKTLTVDQKRMFFGNIVYHEMAFDNGDPVITSGTTATVNSAKLSSNHENTSRYIGYFRDEVYRFGIVYYDKYGNKSPVKVLDLNSVTGNTISGSLPDVHFPTTSLFSGERISSLYLSLTGIKNHPSWAVKFEIVRAKRKKRILSQTPLIPMTYVEGIGSLDDYPSLAVTSTDLTVKPEYPNAQPMTSGKTYVPKNLLRPDLRAISKNKQANGTFGKPGSRIKAGEARYESAAKNSGSNPSAYSTMYMIFPQGHMYNGEPFILSGSEKLEVTKYAKTRAYAVEWDDTTWTGGTPKSGEFVESKTSAVLYANKAGDYYTTLLPSTKSNISGYKTFDNLSPTDTLNNKSIMDYEALQTEGISLGYAPSIQKSVIIDVPELGSGWYRDVMGAVGATFPDGITMRPFSTHDYPFSSDTLLKYEKDTALIPLTNYLVNSYPTYTNTSNYVQAFQIVNIVNDLGDDRYGSVDTQHEFISTGAVYAFTGTEVADNTEISINVWGGDCFVGAHTFKVLDGVHSITNVGKTKSTPLSDSAANLVKWFNKIFFNVDNDNYSAISMPIGIQSAQFIRVILESEYNGEVMDKDILKNAGADAYSELLSLPDKDSIKSPLSYNYNINLSKQNDEKVFFPLPSANFEATDFPSRIIYSDQKVYNTDERGFDVYRVLNTFDLEERHGDLTKLVVESDNMYAIQENGIVYLPTGQSQLEQTDAGILSVGTGDVIGRVRVVDNKRGGQHLRGIVEAGNTVFIPDNENKAVYALSGQQLKIISDMGVATTFRDKFSSAIAEKNLIGLWDAVRKEYWITDPSAAWCHRFDGEAWRGNYDFQSDSFCGGISTNQELFLIGKVANTISAYTMYTGDANQLFGETVTPSVKFIVNPEDEYAKTFDNMMFVASGDLATIDLLVERPDTSQSVLGTIIDGNYIEGNYRVKLPRDGSGARLRGLRLISTVKWDSSTTDVVSLAGVFTKYRLSSRNPW
jgi:hypothetical protein